MLRRRSTYAPCARAFRPTPAIAVLLLAGLMGCGSDDDPKGTDTSADAAAAQASDGGAGNGSGSDAAIATIDRLPDIPLDKAIPIVFVHGFAGSAQQLISQAMRFDQNGYPVGRIRAFEHHGGQVMEDFPGMLDKFVDGVLAEFKVPKVFLIGHSRGTFVSATYLGDPARAAKVAKYVSLDGIGCGAAMTAGVPCIDPNQMNLPGQSHVEVATSVEAFDRMYDFFLGEKPKYSEVMAQKEPVVISGRAVNFPENTGRVGATLDIWEIDSATGMRVGDKALATFTIGDDGNWGPVTVKAEKHYEMLLTSGESYHHHYMQRFLRSTPFVRLLSGPSDTPARMNTNGGPNHAAAVVSRMREWQTTDQLEVSTKTPDATEPPVNVITMGVGVDPTGGSDITSLVRGRIGIHLHDDTATPMMSTLTQIPWFSTQPFQTGVDVYMPAADPPNGTITFKSIPRGDTSRPQVLNTPNWSSSTHLMSLTFSDYAQD